MTSSPLQAPTLSPWLSVWFRPRETIERILATNPRHHVLLLASLGTAAAMLEWVIDQGDTILDWRVIAALVLFGAFLGIAAMYVSALCCSWLGKLIGGRASALEFRAALAWGQVPRIANLVILLLAPIALWSLGEASRPVPPALSAALQIVTAVFALWSLIAIMLMIARIQCFGFWRTIANFTFGLVPLLAAALIVRTFLFQPFYLPSGSMVPTLLAGDSLFVSKYAYGYSRYSLPFSPDVFSGRIFASAPQRGDIVVFRSPKDQAAVFIKRVVGLPNDRVRIIAGVLHINGTPVKRERIDDFTMTEEDGRPVRVKQWQETLPDGVSFQTLDTQDNGFLDNTQEYRVPAGHYFMLGDNRDNSTDSRVLNQIGYVPIENIFGRAAFVYFSVNRKSGSRAIR